VSQELGAHVSAEVARAEQDYQSVRSRALNLIAVGGGLVTLVSGLLAIAAGGSKGDVVDTSTKVILGIGLAAFVASIIVALLINIPGWVTATDVADLREKVEKEWGAEGADQQVAAVEVEYLDSLRQNNRRTAKQLIWSIGFQCVGIAGIALAAVLVLANMSTTATSSQVPARQYCISDSPGRCGPAYPVQPGFHFNPSHSRGGHSF